MSPVGAARVSRVSQVADVIPDSAISRWKFEQDIADSWGNNGGTLNNGSFVTDAAVGSYAIDFGSSGYVTLTNNNLDRGSSESWTFATWLKKSSSGDGWPLAWRGSNALTIFDVRSDDDIRFYVRDDSGSALSTTPNVPEISDGSYHLYTMVYDDSSGLSVYIDDATSLGSDTSTTLGSFTYGTATRFNNDTSDGGIWGGKMDDPRYYSEPLSTTQISDLYNTGSI